MSKKSTSSLDEAEEDNLGQVDGFPPVDNVSCSGSIGSSFANNPRAQLRLAELAEAQEREEAELERKQKILRAANRTRLARLKLELCDMDVKSRLPVVEQQSGHEMVDNYVKSIAAPANYVTAEPHAVRASPVMPRVEMQFFDGNPCHYWKFIRQFENFIESNVADPGQRLLYMLHYCKGQARESIDGCSMLPPRIAYQRAREILTDLYGQSHIIARNMLDELMSSIRNSKSDGNSLTKTSIQLQNCETALCQLECQADLDSLATLEAIVSKLPHSLQLSWARVADLIYKEGRNPRFKDLRHFVTEEARIARSRFGHVAFSNSKSSEKMSSPPRRVHSAVNVEAAGPGGSNYKCYVCDKQHKVTQCSLFESFDVPSRWRSVKRYQACFLCLNTGHRADECRMNIRCTVSGCTRKHNGLLHLTKDLGSENAARSCHNISRCHERVRLGIFPVTIFGAKGSVDTYAMLDNGADISLVKASILVDLGITATNEKLRIRTLNSVSNLDSGTATLSVGPIKSDRPSVVIQRAFCVQMLPKNNCCSASKDASMWTHLKDLDLPELGDKSVGLLIGADAPEAHWILDQRRGRRDEPFAYLTALGWVVLGPVPGAVSHHKTVFSMQNDTDMHKQLMDMYNREFDDSASCEQQFSKDENDAIRMVENSCRLVDGHFEIGLPWRKNCYQLCDNRQQAYSRLRGLRARFIRDPEFFQRYKDVIERNLRLGYSAMVPDDQLHPDFLPRWYLPHHAVINPKKPDKLRVVHDCAAKFKSVSLNDYLYQGPDTLRSLIGILLRFRKEPIALSADIEEMFMQVSVPTLDRAALRYLWWPKHDIFREPVEYQMTVHPFGAVSSPFVANFALRRTITLCEGTELPLVAEAIRDNFYVDDLLISVADEKDAVTLVDQLSQTLSKAGFRIRKWLSNSNKALQHVVEQDLAHPSEQFSLHPPLADRTLGLEWISRTDEFRFSFYPVDTRFTRRGLLSVVSSLFDPLGLVAPLVLPAKLLLQKLCREKLEWDTELCREDIRVWKRWVAGIQQLNSLRIPRCISPTGSDVAKLQLHVFCDASEVGYGALVYIRFEPEVGRPYCSMIYSKSRVAPVKSVTIPRLELVAAKLAVVLFSVVKKEITLDFDQIFFWTDSNIVLHYINNTSTRFSTFVSNRLAAIHQYSTPSQWRHVRSEDNPADLVSRGTYKIGDLRRWLAGPIFLTLPECEWPPSFDSSEPPDGIEMKKITTRVNAAQNQNKLAALLDHFSSWRRLLRAVVWLTRFKQYVVDKRLLQTGGLSIDELSNAERDILRLVQTDAFPECKSLLSSGRSCTKTQGAQLRKLNPIIVDGLICLSGRLIYSAHLSKKFPVVLPSRHPVSELIVRHYHINEGHSGVTHVLSAIRLRYWILRGRTAVKRVIGRCIFCRRFAAQRCQQLMAPLPSARVEPGGYPFQHVGIDYFGPFSVKRGRCIEKRYGCVFSCLQTRAVHLEIAHSLTTDSFILLLMRFIGRRGVPQLIYSDNGTNFVGAQRELRDHISKWDGRRIDERLASQGVRWHFQPPSASHRGGVWERVIRSVRKILFALGLEQAVSDEVLSTLMTEAERILNNRPLVSASSNNDEEVALTPNHILLLRGNPGLPTQVGHACSRGYKQASYLADVFWRRWLREYLPTLQSRQKWLRKHRNLNAGDLVLVADDTTHRGTWPLGRVIECHPSNDGLVRQVSVRTRGVTVRRDIRQLCLLEAACEDGGRVAAEDPPEVGAVT